MRAGVTAALCTTLTTAEAFADAPAAAARTSHAPQTAKAPALTKDQRALHLLSRFTFGTRPGDVQAVERMGEKAWFERQLRPDSIADSALEARLAEYPAMRLTSRQLMQRFPSPATLRKEVRTGEYELPTDPAERAIYTDAIWRVEQRQHGKAAAKAPNAAPGADGRAAARVEALAASAEAGEDAALPEVAALLGEPVAQRLDAIYALPPAQVQPFFRHLSAEQRTALMQGLSPEQKETLASLATAPVQVVAAETLDTRLLRDVYSERQLQAVMTDFWLNHFNVYARKNQIEPYLLNSYERDAILPHALGKFEDLLVSVAESPAMQVYLDNWQSIGTDSRAAERVKEVVARRPNGPIAKKAPKGINENYARELMELHTLGVGCEVSADKPQTDLSAACGSGYTQADVQAVAAVLTGWTVDKPYGEGGAEFTFEPNRHQPGDKRVLGQTVRGGEMDEGLEVLHQLATSPATARFISHKLAVRFVSDTPPAAVEEAMAKTFLKTGGDISAVLRTMVAQKEFWSPAVYRAKVKTPLEFVVSAVRASDSVVTNPTPLVQSLDRLGMPLYGMQTPNGYAWTADEWVSSNALIGRMNFAMVLSGDLMPGTDTDWSRLVGQPAAEVQVPSLATEHQLETELVGQPVSDRTRTVVMEQADRPGQAEEAQRNFAAHPTSDGATVMPAAAGSKAAASQDAGGMMLVRGQAAGKKKRNDAGGFSMTAAAGNAAKETPVAVMGGLLMGSPEFQRR